MYHSGKYADTREPSTHAQWWLTAGCCGLVVTLGFVGMTLWLGMEGGRPSETASTDFRYHQLPPPLPPVFRPEEPRRPSNRGRVEKVRKDEEEKKPTRVKLPLPEGPVKIMTSDVEQTRTYVGPLEKGEELMQETNVKESSVKKKSEAIYPSMFDPDLFSPHNVFNHQVDSTRRDGISNNDLPNVNLQEIPPFTYIRDPEILGFDERLDNIVNNPDRKEASAEFSNSEHSIQGFLRKRLQDVREWLSARGDQQTDSEWVQLLAAFNESVTQRNLTAIMTKLKEMYNATDVTDVPVSSLLYPDARNGSSLLSFGLLAVDLFLLHNVQQIAWTEESRLGEHMLEDPEVVAMNALFLPPDRVRQLRQKGSRVLKTDEEGGNKGLLAEALEFVNSILRAILNLNKAFRSSSRPGRGRQASPNTMDCMWTLYCRNLDKTAKLQGPYGFLAKMNSLGLRLMMGEFPAEKAFSQLMTEATTGWRPIDCHRLFPRCGAEEAREVVMNTVLGEAPA